MQISLRNIFSLAVLFVGLQIQAQQVKKANSAFTNLNYTTAIPLYESLASEEDASEEVVLNLANAYYFQAKYTEANQWYALLFSKTTAVNVNTVLRYAHTLKASGSSEKADALIQNFLSSGNSDKRISEFKSNPDYALEIADNSGRYSVTNAGFNSEFSDYGAVRYRENVVFTSTLKTAKRFKARHQLNGQVFSDLFQVLNADSSSIKDVASFSKKINTPYHESTAVFTKDGNTMYFTRNNYTLKKQNKINTDTVLLKLYKATFNGKKWSASMELPFNSDAYSCAHPALSADEKELYFASNMPGTFGGSDIFKVAILENNTFGTPEHLAGAINTEGRETFPFVTEDNQLYFASDGHFGLGGLDVFVADLTNENATLPRNVGAPVNSQFDDFAFTIDVASKKGFFSSNRTEDNLGFDDVYRLEEQTPLPALTADFSVRVIDAVTQQPLPATIKIAGTKIAGNLLLESNAFGTATFSNLSKRQEVVVTIASEYFEKQTQKLKLTPSVIAKGIDIALNRAPLPLQVGDDIATFLGISIVHFDTDKYTVKASEEPNIEKVVAFMKAYPTVKVAVQSHTDIRGSKQYNQTLSENRAVATVNSLVAHGIAPERITAKGYGETTPVNNCNSTCTAAEHQENRRSEFIILAIE